MNASKWTAVVATASAGLMTGSLAFVSAVDVRSFLQHVAKKETDLIKRHFPVWWPNGRDWMVPLIVMTTAANGVAFLKTKHRNFGIAGGVLFCIAPYTAIVLGEDIDTLRKSDVSEVESTARRFCNLHHVRLLMAAAGFGLTLVALAEL